MVINHPTVFKFAIFDFGPLMYGSSYSPYGHKICALKHGHDGYPPKEY